MGTLTKTTRAILGLLGTNDKLRAIKKPAPLPRVEPLQKFLTEAYDADKSNLEPATMVMGGFTLKNKEAALSILMIDSDGNNHYAEINGTRMDYSGSLVKAAALYAAFDLRSAARQHAKDQDFLTKRAFFDSFTPAIDTSTAIQRLKDFATGLKPDLNKIFQGFKATGPDKVEFTDDFQRDLDNIGENVNAGRIIRALGYSYINASMIRGNFFDPDPAQLNGIWLAGDYSGEQILKSVRVPVANDTVAGGSGQAITTKEMSRMFYLVHAGQGFSHVTDATERTAANQGTHAILRTQGSFFEDTTSTVDITVTPEFSAHCAKVGIGTLGPIGTPGPRVISEGAVMIWIDDTQIDTFNTTFKRKLTGNFVLCWQNMYHPHSHFDALVRIINASILNFLSQKQP
jgi:hypothetical protein